MRHMGKAIEKKNRLLEIFYRAIKGENISVKAMADEYDVSTKSISRDINEIKNFLYENRNLVGSTELKYSQSSKSYYMELDGFLQSKELFSVVKMMIGCRALKEEEIRKIITKLKTFTTRNDRETLDKLISNEIYHYKGVTHKCDSVIENIWKLARCIDKKIEITITYYKMGNECVERRIKPIAIIFSDYYYYLIAYRSDKDDWKPLYYRVDRIRDMVEHREHFEIDTAHSFDEGELRSKILLMFPGKNRRIRFEYTGPSVEAILDKLPTARVIEDSGQAKLIEANVYGTGVNMFLLSQGSWVKPIAPKEFVDEMRGEVEKMIKRYEEKF